MSWRENVTKLLMGKVGGPWEGGIRAYHSSPHDFDRFDWSKLRTGEGANTFGAGFYAAENPAVSGQGGEYWKQFLNRFRETPEGEAARELMKSQFDRAKAAAQLDREARGYIPGSQLHTQINEARKMLESGAPVGPRTYEVNINARPELLLDWDKPMSQQSKVVRDILSSGSPEQWGHDPTGREMYQRISRQMHDRYGQTDRGVQANYASQELAEAGIPGIRYLDQGSRGITREADEMLKTYGTPDRLREVAQKLQREGSPDADYWAKIVRQLDEPQQTYNYVVTDPSKLDILGKYGVVGTAGGGMGVLAAQDQYGAQP